MNQLEKDIRDMHKAFGAFASKHPVNVPTEVKQLRENLIDEEVNRELIPAIRANDVVAVADACVDTLVVVIGTMVAFGIPLQECWDEVHRTNMAKLGEDGKPILRDDGKFLKPEGWQPPDLKRILDEAYNHAVEAAEARVVKDR